MSVLLSVGGELGVAPADQSLQHAWRYAFLLVLRGRRIGRRYTPWLSWTCYHTITHYKIDSFIAPVKTLEITVQALIWSRIQKELCQNDDQKHIPQCNKDKKAFGWEYLIITGNLPETTETPVTSHLSACIQTWLHHHMWRKCRIAALSYQLLQLKTSSGWRPAAHSYYTLMVFTHFPTAECNRKS